ncbi:MAG: 2Fe-2S iron-sulfur cluster binding domain-containing protein [Spirochaetales bacterium]|nr:MAG: 2Fe-2S iron-sulfur cluster binding domain-containing protein [Spirochaetales bacterium]
MIIRFNLNGVPAAPDCNPESRLLQILREQFGLLTVRCGCTSGYCGACSVLLNGELVPSCMVAMFTIKGKSVVTLEGFRASGEYGEILDGFREAGYNPCDYCRPGKVLGIHALLKKIPLPEENEILSGLSGHHCRCNEYSSLIRAVTLVSLKFSRRRS